MLGINRATLRKKLKDYGLSLSRSAGSPTAGRGAAIIRGSFPAGFPMTVRPPARSPGAAVRFRQDRPARTGARAGRAAASSCCPPAAPRKRAARRRPRRARRLRRHRLSRRSWTAASRPCTRRSTAACSAARGTDDAVMARARHRADRPAGGQPVSVRADRRRSPTAAATTPSRTSTSAARRCCARRPRTTRASRWWSTRRSTTRVLAELDAGGGALPAATRFALPRPSPTPRAVRRAQISNWLSAARRRSGARRKPSRRS